MDLLRIPQAAELLGVTRQAIGTAVREGRLKSQEIAGVIFVRRADVEVYEVDTDRQQRGKRRRQREQRGQRER
jgi:helix-turn-helix protein